jgi:hypothetical protein
MREVLKSGHAVLEQCITTEYAKLFPHSLTHQLHLLLNGLELDLKNLWSQEASDYDMQERYPFYTGEVAFESLPPTLQQLQFPEKPAAQAYCKAFGDNFAKWIHDFVTTQMAVMTYSHKDNPEIKRIQDLLETFLKDNAAAVKAESEAKETHAKAHEELLRSWEKKLITAVRSIETRLKASPQLEFEKRTALLNAKHHAEKLRFTLALLKRFPEQRNMHKIFTLLHASARDFTENLGVVLSSHITHSLSKYRTDFGLGATQSAVMKKLMDEMDVHKGLEYPYAWFEGHQDAANVSSLMRMSSKLSRFSFEAAVLGEQAVAATAAAPKKHKSKAKSNDVLPTKEGLVSYAVQFAELVCSLVKEHLG